MNNQADFCICKNNFWCDYSLRPRRLFTNKSRDWLITLKVNTFGQLQSWLFTTEFLKLFTNMKCLLTMKVTWPNWTGEHGCFCVRDYLVSWRHSDVNNYFCSGARTCSEWISTLKLINHFVKTHLYFGSGSALHTL